MNVIEKKRSILRDAVPEELLPSVVFYTRQAVKSTRTNVQKTHRHKLQALSKEQQRPLLDVHDTVKIFDEDIAPPQYLLDTLGLGPKNAVLDKFDPKETLAQIDALLFHCKKSFFRISLMI